MNRNVMICAIVLASFGGQAMAACNTSGRLTAAQITSLVNNQYVCATRGSEKWNELHGAGSVLTDYKKGPSDPVDPTSVVGSWSVTAGGQGGTGAGFITYNYGTGGSYSYFVYGVAPPYTYCNTSTFELFTVTFSPSGTTCP